MPAKWDRCVKDVRKKIKSGEIPKTYVKGGKRYKSSEYKICSKLRAKGKRKSTDDLIEDLVIGVIRPFNKLLKK